MRAVVIIASTQERREITEANRFLLQEQGAEVFVNYATNFMTLGQKWQRCVDEIRNIVREDDTMTHLIVTGSDDLLSKDFVQKYCGEDFTGFKQWYIWHKNSLHHLEYLAIQPLGGGRIYPRWLLEEMNWKVFDITRHRLLDDNGYNYIYQNKKRSQIYYSPDILAVKGDWEMMNKVDLNHRNVRLLKTYKGEQAIKIMKDRFNYEP